MKVSAIAAIAGIFIGGFILGYIQKTCVKCIKCELCLPCEPEIIIQKEQIIKNLKDEIYSIHISNDRRTRDSLRAIYNGR